MLVPISISGGDRRNALTVTAQTTTTSAERRLDNNHASRQLRLWPAATTQTQRALSPVRNPVSR
jgi:hypothetical protein